jgi:hypothetical protein
MQDFQEPPDMESEISDELDPTHTPVDENQNLNQGHESLTAVSNLLQYTCYSPMYMICIILIR